MTTQRTLGLVLGSCIVPGNPVANKAQPQRGPKDLYPLAALCWLFANRGEIYDELLFAVQIQ